MSGRFQTSVDDIYIVIPARDEESYLGPLIEEIHSVDHFNIIVVNDNSSDQTKSIAESFYNVVVLDHIINLGAGAATQTGIAYAVSKKARIIITIDADLQHNPQDIPRLIDFMEQSKCDLVIGSRFLKENKIPRSRIIYNHIANLVSYFLTGKYLTDSQSGFKAISGRLSRSLDLNYDGFEFCMEIIKHAKSSRAKIGEVPINVRYTPETTAKGQNLLSGVRMISRILSPFS